MLYALREFYTDARYYLVLLLDPEPLGQALEHLAQGETGKALVYLGKAAFLYAGEADDPPGRLYRELWETRGEWEGRLETLDQETREALEAYAVWTRVYPVLTGEPGLTLLLAFLWWNAADKDIEAYALVHLDPHLLGQGFSYTRRGLFQREW